MIKTLSIIGGFFMLLKSVKRFLNLGLMITVVFCLSACQNGTTTTSTNTVAGSTTQSSYSVAVGNTATVPVTFTANTGTATNLSVTNLESLPSGWTKQGGGSSFTCSSVAASGTGCQLSLTFAPTAITASTSLTLNYSYTAQDGTAKTGTVTIAYAATSGTYAFIVNNSANNISQCAVVSNELSGCATTTAGSTLQSPFGIATLTIGSNNYAYIANATDSTITQCTIGSDGTLNACTSSNPGNIFNQPRNLAVTTFNGINYIYVPRAGNNTISMCQISNDGSIKSSTCTSLSSGTFNSPFSVAFYTGSNGTPNAYVVNNGNSTFSSCTVNASTGEFSGCTVSAPLGTLSAPIGITEQTFSDTGHLYVVNGTGSLSSCSLNSTSGSISSCAAVAGVSVNQPFTMSFLQDSGTVYSYIPNNGNSTITKCLMDSATGAFGTCSTIDAVTANLNGPAGIGFLNVGG